MTTNTDDLLLRLPTILTPATSVLLSDERDRIARGKRSRSASVAAILRSGARDDDQVELLLIRRAERPDDVWSGHVALPGGHREPTDLDAVATAIRETMEEVGVDLAGASATLLGALPALLPSSPKLPPLTVHPFVWHVIHAEPCTSVEVAATRWVTLAHLRSDEHRVEHMLTMDDGTRIAFPAITLGDEVPLWGMTHRIVGSLLHAIDQASIASGSSSDC